MLPSSASLLPTKQLLQRNRPGTFWVPGLFVCRKPSLKQLLKQQVFLSDLGYEVRAVAAVVAQVGAFGNLYEFDAVGSFAYGQHGQRLEGKVQELLYL